MSKWHEYHSVEVHILTCKKLKNAAGGKGSPMLGKREEDRVCCIINNNTIVMLIEDEIYASCKSSTLSTSEGDFCIGNSWGSYPQTWWFLRFFSYLIIRGCPWPPPRGDPSAWECWKRWLVVLSWESVQLWPQREFLDLFSSWGQISTPGAHSLRHNYSNNTAIIAQQLPGSPRSCITCLNMDSESLEGK